MDYLSTTLDLLSIIVVVIVLSAIIWAMLRYYEIIEQAKPSRKIGTAKRNQLELSRDYA